jgi:hypothetical protein
MYLKNYEAIKIVNMDVNRQAIIYIQIRNIVFTSFSFSVLSKKKYMTKAVKHRIAIKTQNEQEINKNAGQFLSSNII